MDDTESVGGAEPVRQLNADVDHLRNRKAAARCTVAQRFARHVLHHDPGFVTGVDDIEDGRDIPVRQRCCRTRFVEQPVTGNVCRDTGRREPLQRNFAAQTSILGKIDFAHPTVPEPLEDDVGPDRCARHRCSHQRESRQRRSF